MLSPNYAFNPIAELALRSNQTIVPQRVNAALGIMTERTDQTVTTPVSEVEDIWRRNAGLYELWWDREWRIICHADLRERSLTLRDVQYLHKYFPFYRDLSVQLVLAEIRTSERIFVGNLAERLSEEYWKPWVDVGVPVERVRFEQRYYWLEGYIGASHAAVSGEEEIARVRALARQCKFKLHRMRLWE